MSDSRSAPLSLELITNVMNELAREIGIMEPDDPNRPSLLKGLSALTQLRPSVRSAGNQSTEERMNELAREMITLKPGDPMRTRIVQEIIRLSDSFKPANAPGSYAPGSVKVLIAQVAGQNQEP